MTGQPSARPPAGRVVVTSPQTANARPGRTAPSGIVDLEQQTPVGDVLLRSLVRAQLATALRVLVAFVGGLAGLPALFALWPAVGRATVAGVPVPWLLLGFASFPLLVILGVIYLRQAERNEREFESLVSASSASSSASASASEQRTP